MNDWKLSISFSHFYHSDDMSIPEKGQLISKTLRRSVKPFIDNNEFSSYEVEDLIEGFDNITGIPGEMTEVEEFDEQMFQLYELADYHRIWIETN